MLDNNDWLSKQIGMNAINAFLDEYNKPKPGDELTVISNVEGDIYESFDNKAMNAYIKPDGTNAFGKWFEDAHEFKDGKGYVDGGDLGKEFGYIDANGQVGKSDHYFSDRKIVTDRNNMHHYIDRGGNQIGGSYYFEKHLNQNYKDDYAVTLKDSNFNTILIDKNGVEVPQENGDKVLPDGNIGYGYYLTGDIYKLRGLKLKDARTGVTLDRFQDFNDVKDAYGIVSRGVKTLLARFSKKQVPDFESSWNAYKEVYKQNGILFFGNYWFLGPSNIKVTGEKDGYHSKSEFGEFITKLPPIKAIDDNYILCAHNNAIYVYDKKANTYGKTCDRGEVEELIRKKNAKIGYQKFSNGMKALTNFNKLNPKSNATMKVTITSIVCHPIRKDENGLYYELQPVLLEFPQIAKCITYADEDYYVMYNGQRVGISDALRDLRNKASGKNLEEMFNEEELSSGRGK